MMNSLNRRVRILSAGAALALITLAAPQAFAATPADTLVEGFAIDDIITIDPGEAFELSTAEVTANAYSKLSVWIRPIRRRWWAISPKAGRPPRTVSPTPSS